MSAAGTEKNWQAYGGDPAYIAYARARKAEAEVNAFSGDSDGPEYDALFASYIALERKLAATPATSLVGVLGKMKRLASDQGWRSDDPWLASCFGLAVLDDLRRLIAAQDEADRKVCAESDEDQKNYDFDSMEDTIYNLRAAAALFTDLAMGGGSELNQSDLYFLANAIASEADTLYRLHYGRAPD